MATCYYYTSRNVISAVAERRRDWVQAIIDILPPVGDTAEKRDLELWAGGEPTAAYFLILRRVNHDNGIIEKFENMLLDKLES